jgi:hypothetical protein
VVDSTWTTGLDPAKSYLAQLVAIDVDLCAFGSEVAAKATTPTPPSAIVLYRDDLQPGASTYPIPPAFQVNADPEGGSHIEYVALEDTECIPENMNIDEIDAICGQPLRVIELELDLSIDPALPAANRISAAEMSTAFVELRVANDSPVASFFSLFWLRFDDCATDETIFRYDGWVLPASADKLTIQIPLEALVGPDGDSLSYADLDVQASGTPLCGFALGGRWHKAGTVRIDDVVIWH